MLPIFGLFVCALSFFVAWIFGRRRSTIPAGSSRATTSSTKKSKAGIIRETDRQSNHAGKCRERKHSELLVQQTANTIALQNKRTLATRTEQRHRATRRWRDKQQLLSVITASTTRDVSKNIVSGLIHSPLLFITTTQLARVITS